MTILSLSPNDVWKYFNQLNQIPRPSHHEEKIQAFMIKFGHDLGLETLHDDAGNVIIRKPATKGFENRKGVVLQSHLDMVPQANKDSTHNFEIDPIETLIEGDWVKANGTTLGADNGMGVAAIMAILASNNIEHGPIEALFTATEETGMDGAEGLKSGILNGEVLLNLDSEDEGELYVGCAGGIDATFDFAVERQKLSDDFSTLQITLKGLMGGHSGLDIIKQRANANKLLARWLVLAEKDLTIHLVNFNGGTLSNAIPREAEIIIATKDILAVEKHLSDYIKLLHNEYAGIESNIAIDCVPFISEESPMTETCQTKIIHAINACHSGVYRMSVDIPELVETSCNLAIIETKADTLSISLLLRSSVDSAREQLANEIDSIFALANAKQRNFFGAYPGWKPNPESEILSVMKATGQKVFGKIPAVKAIHAGLECGILGGHYPHWDMISFGPTIRGAHSPDERVNIQSVATFYEWLLITLKAIPEKVI